MRTSIAALIVAAAALTACGSADAEDAAPSPAPAVSAPSQYPSEPEPTPDPTPEPQTTTKEAPVTDAQQQPAASLEEDLIAAGVTDPQQQSLLEWWGGMTCQFIASGDVVEERDLSTPDQLVDAFAASGITVSPDQAPAVWRAVRAHKC